MGSPSTALRPNYNLKLRLIVGSPRREVEAGASPPQSPLWHRALDPGPVAPDLEGNLRGVFRNELLQLSTELKVPFPTMEILTDQYRVWLPPRGDNKRTNDPRERRRRDPPQEPPLLNNRIRN